LNACLRLRCQAEPPSLVWCPRNFTVWCPRNFTGRPNTITADMVRDGVVVIDVGVNRVEDAAKQKGYRLVGDVDFDAVKEKASLITPVPGGVGPMTITMLLYNTVESAKRAAGLSPATA